MNFPECADYIFRAELEHAGATRVEPRWTSSDDLKTARRNSHVARRAIASAFASKASTTAAGPRRWRPTPSECAVPGGGPKPPSLSDLPVRWISKHCPTSNTRDITETTVGIPLRSLERPGSRLGRISERSDAIGFASARCGSPPPKSSASTLPMDRPGDGFHQSAHCKLTLCQRVRFPGSSSELAWPRLLRAARHAPLDAVETDDHG